MTEKYKKISALAQETSKNIARNGETWCEYLNTAARLYKYTFKEQMLIFAQRPGATACADIGDSFDSKYKLSLKGALTHELKMGGDIQGNLIRLNNALDAMEEKLNREVETLKDTENQLEIAKIEVEKPFPQEAELGEKTGRLIELNALLNVNEKAMDERGKHTIMNRLEKLKVQNEKNNMRMESGEEKNNGRLGTDRGL